MWQQMTEAHAAMVAVKLGEAFVGTTDAGDGATAAPSGASSSIDGDLRAKARARQAAR